jgi:hypothetical protein
VLGFAIGHVDLQQVQALVNGVGQTQLLHQRMNGADAAAANGAKALRHFVFDSADLEPGPEPHGVFGFVEPTPDSALAFVEPTAENGLHLKSFRDEGA